jgi:hypothetical protein
MSRLIREIRRDLIVSAFVLIASVGSIGFAVQSCASAPTSVVTPQGQAAFKADQFVTALGVLQDSAIAANATTPPLISTADTRLIVQFCVGSAQTAKAAVTGWQAGVIQGLTSLQSNLSAAAQTKYGPYLTLLKTILAGIS